MLNPVFGSRMDAGAAAAQAMNLKFSGGLAPASARAPAPAAAPGGVTTEQRSRFIGFAMEHGEMSFTAAESLIDREIRKGGTRSRNPLRDAEDQVREQKAERDLQRAQASGGGGAAGGVATPAPGLVEYLHVVIAQDIGRVRQWGTPGTPGFVQLPIPADAQPGQRIAFHVPQQQWDTIHGVGR